MYRRGGSWSNKLTCRTAHCVFCVVVYDSKACERQKRKYVCIVWVAANAADPFEERAHRLEFMLSLAFWRYCLTQV